MTMTDRADLARVLREALVDRDLEFDEPSERSFFVKLPGTHKLATMTWLVIGDHSLHVEAFFCRRPDENEERFWRWLLERNAKLYAVAFSVDLLGDVYLIGKLPLSAVTPADRMTATFVPFAPSSPTMAGTVGAGVMITATSGGSGRSAMRP